MLKVIKHLKEYWIIVIAIIALLVLQALGDLKLPEYTSNIVNVGIQQGGIENAAPEAIRAETLEKVNLFMSEEDIKTVEASYSLIDQTSMGEDEYKEAVKSYPAAAYTSVLYLKDTSKETINTLNDIFEVPLVIVYMMENMDADALERAMDSSEMSEQQLAAMSQYLTSGEVDILQMMAEAYAAGYMTKEDLLSIRENVKEQMVNTSESIIRQTAILKITEEYEAIGMDIGSFQTNYLIKTGAKMLGISLLIMVVAVIIGMLASRVAAGVGRDLRSQVFKKVVGFSNGEMNTFSTASLITRSTNDIQQVQMIVVMLLRMVFYAPILGIGGVIKVLNTNTYMAWIIALAVAVIMLLVLVLMVAAMPKFKKMQLLVDRLNLVTREILTGLPVIRAFGREKYEEKRFDDANADLTKTALFTSRVMALMMPVMMLIMNAVTVLILWVGASGVDLGRIQAGDIMAFITYTMQIVMSFLMLTMISIMMPRAMVSASRIDEVINTDLTVKDPDVPQLPKEDKGILQFEDVSFRYPGAEENMLNHISFTARPGETTAIIGSTGSGKTTLIHLIPRFYDVTEGRILLDGIDIRHMSQHDLRKRLGYVPQKGILFSGTVDSNLRFGAQDTDEEQIKKAARIAQAADFIEEKEDGYEQHISQGGTNVSGGQRQRLSIARAIAKNPQIYLFDDSFSALDYKTDAALRQALKDEMTNGTIIIVAQRISTVLKAEQIIVMDDGNVMGIGTHEELLKSCETYQQIARSQLSEAELENVGKESAS